MYYLHGIVLTNSTRRTTSRCFVCTCITLDEWDGGLVEWWRRLVTSTARCFRSTHSPVASSYKVGLTVRPSSTSGTHPTSYTWKSSKTMVSTKHTACWPLLHAVYTCMSMSRPMFIIRLIIIIIIFNFKYTHYYYYYYYLNTGKNEGGKN